MQNIANKIKQPDVCGADYTAQNPLVLQAYGGLLAYASMYQAGCLKDAAGSYCKQLPNKPRTDHLTYSIRLRKCDDGHKFLPRRCLSVLASSRHRHALWCSRDLYYLLEEHYGHSESIGRKLDTTHQQDLRRSSPTHQYWLWTGLCQRHHRFPDKFASKHSLPVYGSHRYTFCYSRGSPLLTSPDDHFFHHFSAIPFYSYTHTHYLIVSTYSDEMVPSSYSFLIRSISFGIGAPGGTKRCDGSAPSCTQLGMAFYGWEKVVCLVTHRAFP